MVCGRSPPQTAAGASGAVPVWPHTTGLISVQGPDVSFEPAVSYLAGTNPRSVAVGDFNGDGRPDLAVAN